MAVPIRSARAEADNRSTTPDKAPTQQTATPAQDDDTLPARVVVQLPDGDILLGEDSGRLRHEQAEQQSQPQVPRVGAQPGSEQWLELRRLLYATGLEAIVLTRKRATSIILGVDLVYMLMAVASIALKGIDTSGARPFGNTIILSLNIFGALLDCITIVMVVKQRRKAIRVVAILHALLLVAIRRGSFIAIVIIRVLLISFLFRLLAALVELQWVVSAQPLSAMPRPAWIQSALLGVNLSSLRSEYFSALQQMAQQSSREAAGGGADVGVHTVELQQQSVAYAAPTALIATAAPGADAPQGSATAAGAAAHVAPVGEGRESSGDGPAAGDAEGARDVAEGSSDARGPEAEGGDAADSGVSGGGVGPAAAGARGA